MTVINILLAEESFKKGFGYYLGTTELQIFPKSPLALKFQKIQSKNTSDNNTWFLFSHITPSSTLFWKSWEAILGVPSAEVHLLLSHCAGFC